MRGHGGEVGLWVVLMSCFVSALFAQGTDTLWTKTYGGDTTDIGYSVQPTQDGGFIITGSTRSFGSGAEDVYLIKTTGNGNPVWLKSYGGTGADIGWAVRQTTDGGYIVTGNTKSFGSQGVYLIKTNANGDTLWTRKYGRTNNDEGYCVAQTADGGYIIAGQIWWTGTHRDAYVIRTNSQGDSIWSKCYGPSGIWDWARWVQQTPDGGYILTGATEIDFNNKRSDAWLFRMDSLGNVIWSRVFGGGDYDYGNYVQRTSDGGYVIMGAARSFSGNRISDVYLIKTDSGGNAGWTKTYGGTGLDDAMSGQQTPDSGYIVAGSTASFGAGGADVWLLKTNANGDTTWAKTYGGPSADQGWSVKQIGGGQYIVAGLTRSFGAGGGDVWLLRVGRLGKIEDGPIAPDPVLLLEISPNPFSKETGIRFQLVDNRQRNIRMRIYDVSGRVREILNIAPQSGGAGNLHWDANALPNGVYFVEIEAGRYLNRQKAIKLE